MRPPILAALAVTCALVSASFPAAAGDTGSTPTTCSVKALPDAHETDFPLLYSPRHDELTVEVGYLGSSFPFESSVETTLMYSFAPFDEQWHFGLRAGVNAGRWGSDDRGPVGLALGARVAADLARPLSGVLAVYAFGQADAIVLAKDGDPVLRPALGLGVRVVRAIGLEANGNAVFSLGDAFANGDRVAGGFGLALNVDICAFLSVCEETAPKPTTVDLTTSLYSAAAAIATQSQKNPAAQADLCKAVGVALDATRYPPSDPGDSTGAFIAGVQANVSDAALKAALHGLGELNASLRYQLVDPANGSRIQSRLQAQKGHVLADECVYAPFPVELRAKLGCEEQASGAAP
jgi:hypothetical protein